LLVGELAGAVDLRFFLRDGWAGAARSRRLFARRLGEALARMHEAGFDHPDLYAKHVLVDPRSGQIFFLDWQRSQQRRWVGWRQRCRDLAALDATLVEHLSPQRERLVCLRAYLRCTQALGRGDWSRATVTRMRKQIHRQARRLLRKRHIQVDRRLPLAPGGQSLLWLDGEALCVTPAFWAELQGRVPTWLPLAPKPGLRGRTERGEVELPGGRRGLLVRRWRLQPLGWLWAALRGKRLESPELRQATTIFRRQRQGLDAPRLLAYGQRRCFPWRTESFLLTEVAAPDTGREP
jgi:hypothetical protein